jgi:hypothetical protein
VTVAELVKELSTVPGHADFVVMAGDRYERGFWPVEATALLPFGEGDVKIGVIFSRRAGYQDFREVH